MASEGETAITSDEIIDRQCSVCKKGNKTVEADTYCVDCQDYYCEACVDIHKTVPALENHNLVDKDAASDGEALPSVIRSRCDRHVTKIIDMYCQDHDEVGCSTCMTVDHRNCKEVFDISEFVQNNSTVVPEFLKAIQDVVSELKAFLNTFRLGQILLLHNKQPVIDQIQALRMRLENSIRKSAEDAIQKVDEEFAKLNAEIKVKIKVISDEVETINKTYKEIISSSCSLPEAFVLSKKEKTCIPAARKVKDNMKGVELDRRFAFVPHNVYEEILRHTEACLGNVTVTPYAYVFSKIGHVDLQTLQAEAYHLFYDSCCTSDGSIFFTDMTNKMLIRVCSENLKVIGHVNLPSSPFGVCCISENSIAVCLETTFQIFRINDGIQLTRTVHSKVACYGISCHENKVYVASGDCVFKYNMQGKLLQLYNKDADGNNIFSDIMNLVINPFSKHLHIADLDNGVITMDQKGSVVNIVKDNTTSPWGITVDKYGQVFVRGFTCNTIVQLNSDGKYIQTVINEGLSAPRALCIDDTMGRMYVANDNARDIIVFNAK